MKQLIGLPDDEAKRIIKDLQGKIPRMSTAQKINFIIAISLENARLAREVNEHRKALGIEPMRIYIPGEVEPSEENSCTWKIDGDTGEHTCSNCDICLLFEDDADAEDSDYRFCPRCGAKITKFEHFSSWDEQEDQDVL